MPGAGEGSHTRRRSLYPHFGEKLCDSGGQERRESRFLKGLGAPSSLEPPLQTAEGRRCGPLEVSLPKAPRGTSGAGHWQGQRYRPRIGCGPRGLALSLSSGQASSISVFSGPQLPHPLQEGEVGPEPLFAVHVAAPGRRGAA